MLSFTQGGVIEYDRLKQCRDCRHGGDPVDVVLDSIGSTDLQRHDRSEYVPVIGHFRPHLESAQRECVAAVENEEANAGAYPTAPLNEIWLSVIPPKTIFKAIGIVFDEKPKLYGSTSTTLDGLEFDVVAEAFDVDGVSQGPVPLPAGFTGFVASTAEKTVAAVSPADGGYHTGDNYVLVGFKVTANPTGNPLSRIDSGFAVIPQVLSFTAY